MEKLKDYYKQFRILHEGKPIELTRVSPILIEYFRMVPKAGTDNEDFVESHVLKYKGHSYDHLKVEDLTLPKLLSIARIVQKTGDVILSMDDMPDTGVFKDPDPNDVRTLLAFTKFIFTLAGTSDLTYSIPADALVGLQRECQDEELVSEYIADQLGQIKSDLSNFESLAMDTYENIQETSDIYEPFGIDTDFLSPICSKLQTLEDNAEEMRHKIAESLDVYNEQMQEAKQQLEDAQENFRHELKNF